MEDAIRNAVEAWLSDSAIAEPDRQDIRRLCEAGDDAELTDRFYRRLAFGTGGLRGVIGAGLNRINIYTVGAAAQGLANTIAAEGQAAREAGVAIAFDCRRMSTAFARRTASVMAGNGIRAWLCENLRPTPELSFAVRYLGAAAGVVITASHNPPEYNGFKVFWSDGAQVVPPHDQRIMDEVERVTSFANIQARDFEEARAAGVITLLGRDLDEAFLQEVQRSCLVPELCRAEGSRVGIVFTALHGTGATLIPEALRRRGFERVLSVPEQAEGDGEFPTVASPNPEEPAALALATDYARREQADLVIATDPDADRMGVAVPDGTGTYVPLSGNRTAALLTYFICEQLTRDGRFPGNAVLITTVVSGELMKAIARAYGAEVVETLTGFKWIGQLVTEYENAAAAGQPSMTYIFGAEESYGYMPATFTRDKDAVTSAAYIADVAAWARSRGMALYELLHKLFRQFGYYEEALRSVTLKGRAGAEKIRAGMAALRRDPPRQLGGLEVERITDLVNGEVRARGSGEVIERLHLPPADVVLLTLADGTRAVARPSGTEPKIKFYIMTRESSEDLEAARTIAGRRIEAVMNDLVSRAT